MRLNFGRGGISTTVAARVAAQAAPVAPPPPPPVRLPTPPQQRGFGGTPFTSRLTGWPSPEAAAGPAAGAEPAVTTTDGMGQLEALVNDAAVRRRVLAKTVAAETAVAAKTRGRLRLARIFLLRIFTVDQIPKLTAALAAAEAKLAAAQAELESCRVEVDFGLDEAALNSYAALVNAFDALRAAEAIWDVTSGRSKEALADEPTAIERIPVKFERAPPGEIACSQPVLRLGGEAGRDIDIYPGLVITRGRGGALALHEFGAMITSCASTQFAEPGKVPTDAEVVGEARVKDNEAIPVVRYGELEMVSLGAHHQVYLASDFDRVSGFVRAYLRHVAAMAELAKRAPANAGRPPDVILAGPAAVAEPEPPLRKPVLVFDWIALIGLVMLATFGVMTLKDAMTPAPPPPAAAKAQPSELDREETAPAKTGSRPTRRGAKTAGSGETAAPPPAPPANPDDPATGIPY